MRLFCDLDGVLADFERGYYEAFDIKTSKVLDNADWSIVATREDFYANLPPMPDMRELWDYIGTKYRPTILTGIPKAIDRQRNGKVAWCASNLGPHVPVICCRASEKFHHCRPGDLLIDDWEKHRSKWEKVGGLWITHTSAASTVERLKELGL